MTRQFIDRLKPLTWEKLDELLHCVSGKRYGDIELYRKYGNEFVADYVTGYITKIVEPLELGGGKYKMQKKKQLCYHDPHPINLLEVFKTDNELADSGEYFLKFYDIEDFYYLPTEEVV